MRPITAIGILMLAALGSASCQSCLKLDDYQLVPAGFVVGGGGYGAGIPTGAYSGMGGIPSDCDQVYGEVMVAVPVEPGGTAAPCGAAPSETGGVRLYTLDPATGFCTAYASIDRASGTTSVHAIHVERATDGVGHVAGVFSGGPLQLPNRCSDSTALQLDLPPGASEALFVASLYTWGSPPCTEWVRAAGTAVTGALRLGALEVDGSGGVLVGGGLGNATATFSDATSTKSIDGAAFAAHYRSDGTLDGAIGLRGQPFDQVLGLAASGGEWLGTGALTYEQPSCQGCTGVCNVLEPAIACQGVGGEAGSGGVGGSGGTAGQGGTGGGGGGHGDGINAFLWQAPSSMQSCDGLDTFGSDRSGPADAQAGFGIATRSTVSGACTAYWTGLGGRDAWRLAAADPASSLFDTAGAFADGFVARLDGNPPSGCASGALGHAWNIRLTPSVPGAVAWGNRIAARRCPEGAVLTAFVTGAPLGTVTLHRCLESGGCDTSGPDIQLLDAASQLLVVGLGADGSLSWHGELGPMAVDSYAVGAAVMGQVRDNLVLDNRDHVRLVVESTGPLLTGNLSVASCPELALAAGPATFAIALSADGQAGQAECEWAAQLGP